MRIGNIEDMEKTKKSPEPEIPEPGEMTKGKKWKNWWYYHKWYVLAGAVILWIAGSLIGSMLGIGKRVPDFQIAYVGSSTLPPETATALETAFASLASDYNGDGEVFVQLNQYTLHSGDGEMLYDYASELSLMGDISACQSYFFLTDDPAYFQDQYQIFAAPDGSAPEDADHSVDDKVILWKDCPLLFQQELGTYSLSLLDQEIAGNNQELLSGLFLGRRCFYEDDTTPNALKCSQLWELLRDSKGTV